MKFNLRFFAVMLAVIGTVGGVSFYMNQATAEGTKEAAVETAAGEPAAKSKPLKDAIKADQVYATFEGGKLTGKDVKAFVDKMPPQLQNAPSENLLEMVVNQLVNDQLVDQAVADQKIADDKEAQARIAEATEQILRARFVEKSLDGKISDSAVKKKYDEVVAKVPDENEVHARHILVADEKTANEILAKLKKGETFEKLAGEYSTDATKSTGGDLGYFVKGAMVPEFGNAAFAMKKGEVSKAAIKTQFGYHLIKVEDVRKRAKPTFDQVKDRIRAQLSEEQMRSLIDALRLKAKVAVTLPQS